MYSEVRALEESVSGEYIPLVFLDHFPSDSPAIIPIPEVEKILGFILLVLQSALFVLPPCFSSGAIG